MQHFVFKVCRTVDWNDARREGSYRGSADDLRDGFIHLSCANQLSETLAKHFSGQPDLVLVFLETSRLGTVLRWEASRGGQLFPHLYSALDPNIAHRVVPLHLDAEWRHQLPEDLNKC